MPHFGIRCWLGALILLLAAAAPLCAETADAYADKRKKVALVIGNAAYQGVKPLQDTIPDATLIGSRFQTAGFAVRTLADATQEALAKAFEEFLIEADGADIAAVYFAGHGMQINGENYLVPTDFDPDKGPIYAQLVSLTRMLARLDKRANAKIVLLDACRNNPFAKRVGALIGDAALSEGLAPMAIRADGKEASDARLRAYGMIVGYAAEPNRLAYEGPGENGRYAVALAEAMKFLDEDMSSILVRAARLVDKATRERQRPEHRIALTRPLFLQLRARPFDCDVLAAEEDNNISVKGVAFDRIDVVQALPACRADLAQDPDNPRLMHNLARVLDKAGQDAEAVRLFRQAATIGYDWSQNYLAIMLIYGEGVEPSIPEALEWLRKAHAMGNRQAAVNYADTDLSALLTDSPWRRELLAAALTKLGYQAGTGADAEVLWQALERFKAERKLRGAGLTFEVSDALGVSEQVFSERE